LCAGCRAPLWPAPLAALAPPPPPALLAPPDCDTLLKASPSSPPKRALPAPPLWLAAALASSMHQSKPLSSGRRVYVLKGTGALVE